MGRIKDVIRLWKGSFRCAKAEGLNCGKDVAVMGGCNFGSEPYLITFENHVCISYHVSFITHDGGNFAFRHEEPYCEVNHFGKIHVGEYSFIGANSIILPGVRIGKHCVIGAGRVVTKSIPDGCVAAGVPARVISTTAEYAEKMKERMPDGWDPAAYHANKREYLIRNIEEPPIEQSK